MIKNKKSIISLVVSLGLIGVVTTTPVHAGTVKKTVGTSVSKISKTTAQVKQREYISKVKNLNVRSAAKTNAKVLGKIKKGEVVIGLEKLKNGWIKVEYKGKIGYVSNSKGKYLKEGPYVEDRKNANKVVSAIKSISKKVTLKDKSKVTKARKAYNALNKTSKSLVTNLSTLTKAESTITKLENQKSADEVISAIKSISKKVTLKDKSKVTKARKSYNTLNKTAKSLVTNLSTLTKAEATITKLEEALKKDQENQKQASIVINLINELNETITLNDIDAVAKARDLFNMLNTDAQCMVTNIDTLLNAESELIKLKEMQLNQDKANPVIELINSINSVISLEDKAFIEKVQAVYDQLNSEAKAMVTNIDTLVDAQAEISRLEKEKVDKELSQDVVNIICEIENLSNINLDNKDLIVKARSSYEKLNAEAKAMVTREVLSVLENAELKIVQLEKEKVDIERAKIVENQINSLNKPIVISDNKTIANIRGEFNKLSKEAKLLVSNIDVLEAAEAEIAIKGNRYNKAMNLIAKLPDDITLEHETQIIEARNAFEVLAQDEKDLVLSMKYHYQILTRAEEALERLKKN